MHFLPEGLPDEAVRGPAAAGQLLLLHAATGNRAMTPVTRPRWRTADTIGALFLLGTIAGIMLTLVCQKPVVP